MLELEKDLHLTAEDFSAMRTQPSPDAQDLDFLEGIGAFESKKGDASPFTEEFSL
jgi:hypothetical protein